MTGESSQDLGLGSTQPSGKERTTGAHRGSERQVFESLQIETVGVIYFDYDGQITNANDAFLSMSGFSREELDAGRLRWEALTPEEWIPASEQAIAELKANGHTRPYEKEYFRKDGSRWWGHFAAQALSDRGGMEFILDITERKQAEHALRQSEEKYRTLFDSIDEGYAICEMIYNENNDPVDYRFLEVNAQFENLTGLSRAEALSGKTIRQILPDLEEKWYQIYGQIALTGEPVRFEENSDVMGRWFDVYAFRIEAPARRRVAILYQDITERKRKELNAAFLADLGDTFARLSSLNEIMHAAGEQTFQFYNLSRLTFSYVDEAADVMTTIYDKRAPGSRSALGDQRVSDFVSNDYLRDFKAGRVVVVNDVTTDPRTSARASAYQALGVGAQLLAPFVSEGLWRFVITLQKDEPYAWRADEVALLEELAPRIHLCLERASTEEALRWASEQDAFRANLADALRPIVDPVEIQAEAARVLGGHLGVSRALYAEADAGGAEVVIERDYVDGVPSVTGRYWLDRFGPTLMNEIRAGRVVAVADVTDSAAEPRLSEAERGAYESVGVRAYLAVPLVKAGRFVAYLGLHQSEPRAWTDADIALAEETAERTWAAVERARAEMALRESEERIRAIYDGTYEYIGLLAPDGILIETNRASLEFAGNTREDVVGRPFWETPWFTNTPGASEGVRQALTRAAEGEFVRYELPLNSPSGHVITFDFSLHPIRNERGEIVFIVPEGRDITEHKLAEEERERALQVAEEAVRARDMFLSIASHELRNPVTSIKASAQLMRRAFEQGRLNEQNAAKYTTTLIESGNRLAALVDDLLDVSRLRSGQLRMHTQPTNLADLVRETVRLQSASTEDHRLRLTLEDGHRLPLDADRIRQVLVNVLDNAMKYSPDGGEVGVQLTFDDSGAWLSVKDEGIGLPEDSLESIFEPFGRAQNAAESNLPGMGLGLYICRRIAEAHGGKLWAESEGVDKGTTMCLWLPIENEESGTSSALNEDRGYQDL